MSRTTSTFLIIRSASRTRAKAAQVSAYGIAPGMRADHVVVSAALAHGVLPVQPPRRHGIKDGREAAHACLTWELVV